MDSATAAKAARIDERTAEQIEKDAKRNSIMLTRTRVLHDLQTACNARYRQQLQEALAHLDQQLAALD